MKTLNNFILLYFVLVIVSKQSRNQGYFDNMKTLDMVVPRKIITRSKKKHVHVIVRCDEYEQKQYELEKFGKIIYRLPMIDSYVIDIEKDKVKYIQSNEDLWQVEVDAHITAQMNRARDIIGVNWAHEHGFYGEGVGVAILDTGISLHPDFTEGGNRVVAFQDFINHRMDPYDDNGHGTQVNGT